MSFFPFWVLWNSFLAILPFELANRLPFVWKSKNLLKWVKYPYLIILILFIPNTIYLLTDWVHTFDWGPEGNKFLYYAFSNSVTFQDYLNNWQWGFSDWWRYYIINLILTPLGIITYWYSTKKLFITLKLSFYWQLGMHFIFAIGVYLGRFPRLNSWDHPINVITTLQNLLSPVELMFVFGWTLVNLGSWFLAEKLALKLFPNLNHKVFKQPN